MYVCTYVNTYIRMCRSCSGMSICTHMYAEELYITCVGEYQMPSLGLAKEDREEQHFLTMEVQQRGWFFATYAFCGVEY